MQAARLSFILRAALVFAALSGLPGLAGCRRPVGDGSAATQAAANPNQQPSAPQNPANPTPLNPNPQTPTTPTTPTTPPPPPPPPPTPTPPAARTKLPPFDGSGALAGKRIIISPGHGYYYTGSSWTTQRGVTNGLIEDIHTAEIAMDYLIPMLERAGARVYSARERSRQEQEAVVDNDGVTGFSTQGSWPTSVYTGYSGGAYQYAALATAGSATWSYTPAQQGVFPVWVWYVEGTNRTTAAHYVIEHSGGTATVDVNQKTNGSRWLYIGEYPVSSGDTIRVTLEHTAATNGVSIADAVRFGAGFGASGHPRWKECSRYWLPFLGAPASVYDDPTLSDRNDDITARGNYAVWQGGDAYLSIHTNASGGTGTETFIHDTAPALGSDSLRATVNADIVKTTRQLYEPNWANRGLKQANFGELRTANNLPAVLTELAFHDRATPDAALIARQDWRHDTARAMYRSLLGFLNSGGTMAPLPPTQPTLGAPGNGQVSLSWQAVADPMSPGATPSGYWVAWSADGFAFNQGTDVGSGASTLISGFTPGTTLSFRVIARNAGGESAPSEAAAITVQ